MRQARIHRISSVAMLILSFVALLTVMTGYLQSPQNDEGAAAHIFQLTIVTLAPMVLLFLATADWTRPRRNAKPLAISASALTCAFGALYYLEHFR